MRRFGTIDLAIVLGLWSAMAVVLGGVLSELMGDAEMPRARMQSEAYALQIFQSLSRDGIDQVDQTGTAGTRGPASVNPPALELKAGELGRDPWGHNYRYRVFAGGVLVWSLGPDGNPDSDEAIGRLAAEGKTVSFQFGGDDVGFLKVSHKRR